MLDRSRIDVEDLLQFHEVSALERATVTEFRFSCPFPEHMHGDTTPSAYMNVDTTAWVCFSCKRRGDAVGFISQLMGVSPMAAEADLKERYGMDFREPKGGVVAELKRMFAKHEEVEEVHVRPTSNDLFAVDWRRLEAEYLTEREESFVSYMGHRGFTAETLDDWGFGYDTWTRRITIPVRDAAGELFGFKGRGWQTDQRPKYLVLGDRPRGRLRYGAGYGFTCYPVSQVVFGLERAVGSRGRRLVLCEGELDVVALHSYGVEDACGLGSSNLSRTQIELLRMNADEVVLFFDSVKDSGEEDTAGREATRITAEALAPFVSRIRIVGEHQGDPASMGAEAARALIDDADDYRLALLRSRW